MTEHLVPPRPEAVWVDATKARELLGHHDNWRALKPNLLRRYVQDMREGRWAPNSTLQVDMEGRLVDGQHRLRAVIATDTAQWFVVLYDVAPGDVEVIDTGVSRSFADLLRHEGYKGRSKAVASAVTVAMAWEAGVITASGSSMDLGLSSRAKLDWLQDHPRLADMHPDGQRLYSTLRLPVSAGMAFTYRGRTESPALVDEFLDAVCDAREPSSAAIVFRRWCLGRAADQRRTSTPEYLALTIKAWNAHHVGRPVERLLWLVRRGEPFPRMMTQRDLGQ